MCYHVQPPKSRRGGELAMPFRPQVWGLTFCLLHTMDLMILWVTVGQQCPEIFHENRKSVHTHRLLGGPGSPTWMHLRISWEACRMCTSLDSAVRHLHCASAPCRLTATDSTLELCTPVILTCRSHKHNVLLCLYLYYSSTWNVLLLYFYWPS